MFMTNLLSLLTDHNVLFGLLSVLILLVLHLPYRIDFRQDRKGRASVIVQSVLYRYAYGPSYRRLDYTGLRHVQRAVVDFLVAVWQTLRGDALRRVLNALRSWLGL